MKKSQEESAESIWMSIQQKYDFHEDIILKIPQFAAIERFFLHAGEHLDGMFE